MPDHVYAQPILGQGTTLGAATSAAPSTAFLPTPTGAPTTVALSWIRSIKTDFGTGVHEWGNLAQAVKRRMPTILDMGELSGSIQFLPGDTSNKTLWGLFHAKTIVYWLITMTDTSVIGFNGFISKLGPNFEQEDEVDADFTISIDGDVIVIPTA